MKKIHPVRLFIKTLIFFVVINLLFALWNPPVEQLSLYNRVFPGRTRFPYGLGERTVTITDLDALFASHEISAPKGENEFRVVVLGDSSIWGDDLESYQTAVTYMNETPLLCAGKETKFYNLGYPHLAAMKDILILKHAMDFDPDAIIWSFTLRTVLPKPPNPFLQANAARVLALEEEYTLPPYPNEELVYQPEKIYDKTLIGKRVYLAWLLKLQTLGGIWAAMGTDTPTLYLAPGEFAPSAPPDRNDLDADISYREFDGPNNELVPYLWLEYLDAAEAITGNVPILFVNQPMFIATGENSDLHYNEAYPRWAYDQYHDFIIVDAAAKNRNLLDLWNAIDANYFTGATFHLLPAGEQIKAELLRDGFQAQICGE